MSHKDPKRLSSAYYRREPHAPHLDRSRDRYYGSSGGGATSERYNDGLKHHSSSSSKSHYLSTPTTSSSLRYSGVTGSSGSIRRHSYHPHSSSSSHPEYGHGHHYESSSSRGAVVSSSSHSHYSSRSGKDPKHDYYDRATSGSSSRRVPPPLTPPHSTHHHHHIAPLMKMKPSSSSPSSRYRRAPPEDHHASYRGRGSSLSSRDPKRSRADVAAPRKRTSVPDQEDGSSDAKKKKETELVEGATVVDEVIGDGDDEPEPPETNAEDKKVKHESNEAESADANDKGEGEDESSHQHQTPTNFKTLLKLNCPYCDLSCVTLREFVHHTKSYEHGCEMTRVVGGMKKKVAQLRMTQRDEQKELEKSEDGKKDLSDTTSYCRVCELNFRTDPKLHEAQPLHNKLKSLVDRTCEVCDIQFKFWKVYIYHVVALEHVKRVALLEVAEKEAKGECIIKGTNLTEEELGMNLMEQRTVFYCNACVRYLPIRDGPEETKARHCMSIGHIKFVDEYRQRIRRAERRAKAAGHSHGHSAAGEDKEKKNTSAAAESATGAGSSAEAEANHIKNESSGDKEELQQQGGGGDSGERQNGPASGSGSEKGRSGLKEEVDEDEIQLHAEEDDSVSAHSC